MRISYAWIPENGEFTACIFNIRPVCKVNSVSLGNTQLPLG
jgi:hypothetical protein